MFMAILLVTVFVVDEDTAVEAKALPETVGKVIVVVPAIALAAKVNVPLVSPVMYIELMVYPYLTTIMLMFAPS
jgi:hypothetical protein